MSDNTETKPEPTNAKSINAQVAERIKGCAPEVEKRLVETLAEKEVSRRVEVIGQGLAKLSELEREGYKLKKPTQTTYDLEGNVTGQSYTKEALEAIKKHGEKTDKLERAINKALKGDISDLAGLVK